MVPLCSCALALQPCGPPSMKWHEMLLRGARRRSIDPQLDLMQPLSAPAAAQAEAHEQALQQQVAVCQLELRKLGTALEARRRRADEAQRKLQALLP